MERHGLVLDLGLVRNWSWKCRGHPARSSCSPRSSVCMRLAHCQAAVLSLQNEAGLKCSFLKISVY
jgi:hypothetical protein